jgi:phosphohistidine phosphatase
MAVADGAGRRRLIIVRHAKADRPGGVLDLDRPLSERGHTDTGAAGAWLAKHGYRPDLVICSPARRTRQTWHGIAVSLATGTDGTAPDVRYEGALYDSNVDDILPLVQAIEPAFTTALLVGHNPSVSQLSALLDPDGTRDSDGLRTCALAVHEWAGAWATCGPGTAPLVAGHTARTD